jgi:hypothetical protein
MKRKSQQDTIDDEQQHDTKRQKVADDADDLLLKSESAPVKVKTVEQKNAMKNLLLRAYAPKNNTTAAVTTPAPKSSEIVTNKKEKKKEKNKIELNHLDTIPLDWSIQTNVKFTSRKSFVWMSHLTDMAKTYGLRSFVARKNNVTSESSQSSHGCSQQLTDDQPMNLSLDACSELYRYMLYFQFPASQLPSSVQEKMKLLSFQENTKRESVKDTEYMGASDVNENTHTNREQEFSIHGYQIFKDILQDDAEFLNERMQDWCDSFQSIYTLLCTGDCPYFYVIHDNRLAVLFINGSVAKSNLPIRAIVSHANTDVTKQKLEQNNVTYQQQSGSSFIFVGRRQVSALFAYMLADCVKHISSDFPTIIAPIAFMNSSLKSLRITQNRSTTINKNNDSANQEQLYQVEFTGFILPHARVGLCKTVADVFTADTGTEEDRPLFTSTGSVHTLSPNFNQQSVEDDATVPSPSQSQASQSPASKCVWQQAGKRYNDDADEDLFDCLRSENAQIAAEMTNCFTSKIILNKNGSYTVKLSKSS